MYVDGYGIKFDTLSFYVFKLHVTNGNRHHFIVDWIVNMASEDCPVLDTFDMIKHDLGCLEVTIRLHLHHQDSINANKEPRYHDLLNSISPTLAHQIQTIPYESNNMNTNPHIVMEKLHSTS